ncbi:hypothetical protein GCM10009091_17230 [Pseudomonas brenneri]|nr:hypothetical protein GCM10009091_17230 [Pseudomonas brenneri]
MFHAQSTYRGQAIAGAIEALFDAGTQQFGEVDVEGHGGRSRGTSTDEGKIQDSARVWQYLYGFNKGWLNL